MRKVSCLLSFFGIASIAAIRSSDFVLSLPNCDRLSSDWFSGYLNVDQNKALHYVLVTSLNDYKNDPLVIWFNGGPGCSSLLALFQEHGPFVIDDGEYSIKKNP